MPYAKTFNREDPVGDLKRSDMDRKEQNNSQLVIYQTETGETKIDVRFQNETVWLSQQLMAELFQTTKQNISLHIANIYEDKELLPQATVKEFLTVQKEGNRQVTRSLEYYNLDMIISVGYRIKSKVATHFRQWATRHLREFIVKGFVLDDERLKNPLSLRLKRLRLNTAGMQRRDSWLMTRKEMRLIC